MLVVLGWNISVAKIDHAARYCHVVCGGRRTAAAQPKVLQQAGVLGLD